MLFPKCVRIDVDDERSAIFLEKDGWYDIGVLETFVAPVARWRKPSSSTQVLHGNLRDDAAEERIIALTTAIQWSGRLSRDRNIPHDKAIAKIVSRVRKLFEKSALVIHGDYEAFGFFCFEERALRVKLIGVHPDSQSRGCAKAILETAQSRWPMGLLIAATYDDNHRAVRLYKSFGMHSLKRERTFHK